MPVSDGVSMYNGVSADPHLFVCTVQLSCFNFIAMKFYVRFSIHIMHRTKCLDVSV